MNDYKQQIKDTVSQSIKSFFENKTIEVTHPLDRIFPNERRIRSLIGGLETSLGTRVWEPICKLFAKNNGFEVLDEKQFNSSVPEIPEEVRYKLSDFEERKAKTPSLKLSSYQLEIKQFILDKKITVNKYTKIPKGEGVDIWLRKGDQQFLIDIKTTQLNAGSGPKLTKNLLNWYTYAALNTVQGKDLETRCMLGFPFNPHTGKNYWVKEKGKVQPLIPSEEALVADEFWNLFSGMRNTTDFILQTFEELGKENFGDIFKEYFRAQ